MDLHRLSVKYFLADAEALKLEELVPVFHRWIQEHVLEGLLIDVADYRHVKEGPGVVLIGHQGDYSLDTAGGRPGLLYVRKREMEGDLEAKVETALRAALAGCRAIEEEPALGGRLRFRADEARIAFPDRLRAPRGKETFEALRAGIEAAVRKLYRGVDVSIIPSAGDARECFAVDVRAPGAPPLAALLARL